MTISSTSPMRGTDDAALASVATETRLAELDAGNLPADVAAIRSDPAGRFYDSLYPVALPASMGSVNIFGAWVEVSADIGTDKKVYYAVFGKPHTFPVTSWEIEVGEGASTSEVAVARAFGSWAGSVAGGSPIVIPLHLNLTNNARITVRVRDNRGAVLVWRLGLLIGAR